MISTPALEEPLEILAAADVDEPDDLVELAEGAIQRRVIALSRACAVREEQLRPRSSLPVLHVVTNETTGREGLGGDAWNGLFVGPCVRVHVLPAIPGSAAERGEEGNVVAGGRLHPSGRRSSMERTAKMRTSPAAGVGLAHTPCSRNRLLRGHMLASRARQGERTRRPVRPSAGERHESRRNRLRGARLAARARAHPPGDRPHARPVGARCRGRDRRREARRGRGRDRQVVVGIDGASVRELDGAIGIAAPLAAEIGAAMVYRRPLEPDFASALEQHVAQLFE